jgi:hypothetical protein
MGLDQEVCGACRRPRDEREIEQGQELTRERARRRRRRPYEIARVAVAAVSLAVIYHRREVLLSYLRPAPESPAAPAVLVSASLPRPPAAILWTRPSPDPAAANTASRVLIRPGASPAPPAVMELPPRPAVRPPEPQQCPGRRCVYGVVYDIESLSPVARATVTLLDSADATAVKTVETDADGRYGIVFPPVLPPDATPLITVAAPGYRAGQLEDPNAASFLERPARDREELVAELSSGDLEPVPVRYAPSETMILLDLALVPARPGNAAR